jgi:hypothetical protein
MVCQFGSLAEDGGGIVAVLAYSFAGRPLNGFSVFHATPTPAQPEVPGRLEIRQRRYRREGRIRP